MNQETILPEDPRLTAYALGEMEPAERAEFEKLLARQPEAQRAVEEIRTLADSLGGVLASEPAPAAREMELPYAAPPKRGLAKVLRFPQLYFAVSTAAAACFAVIFAYWQYKERQLDRAWQNVTEIQLAPSTSPGPETVDTKLNEPLAREMNAAMPVTALPPSGPGESDRLVANAAGQTARLDASGAKIPVAIGSVSHAEALAQSQKEAQQIQLGYYATQATAAKAPQDKAAALKPKEEETVRLSAFQVSAAPAKRVSGGAVRGILSARALNFAPATPPPPPPALAERLDLAQESYATFDENPFRAVAREPLSTFSIDTDTAAYANVRRLLTQGQRPQRDAVRIEELVNYFPYRYAPPADRTPFAASLEVASAPWAPEHRLVRIGLKGRELSEAARPAANLVFLLDVSGSMEAPNKLPLVKQALRLLVEKLRADDQVAVVVYAGASGLALPSTSAKVKAKILAAIDELRPQGSTNGAAGIQRAYDIAKANFITGGVNRVILATDGDFNVGTTGSGELTDLIQKKAKSGVFLTVLGFGMGNLKDDRLERLADKGNGNYAYIDNAQEAKKALVEQAGGTLVTIAKDVKLQVEFNPAQWQAYRLIGYENRALRSEDFNNDKVDAGEIGAGHTVTALYELVPTGVPMPEEVGRVEALKYRKTGVGSEESGVGSRPGDTSELLTLKVRYKAPEADASKLVEFPLRDSGAQFAEASADFKFAASVAAFGMILRESPHKGTSTFATVSDWARAGIVDDAGGYRAEFLGLVKQAEILAN